ncbi:response regulator transcription factor [Oharaeibacter diazotrophicus]|uniref:LuxR family two component transcriptional regulator n=1 Tax=Oharaeibacter diazotrophicus TaxID=1920512 RepID=A0A4R6RGG4_9HYPH|nr:response regulator transcription factor [Oharaeibacter diazotrophicus]TDP85469.1 LuxR family two component transcriptional regulator [Oharaeibacter diazotrophicus]BBE74439.1 response regulator receiver protein MxcE2 [Pleomorphomonas sp. SM30]GLS75865.1 DNA-binding response regulator [Oharaeibacter diazotrophicus]
MTRVLIVDDHPIVLQGCRRLMEEHGACAVEVAERFPQAFRAWRRQRPDVIIVDIGMPNRTLAGLSFVRRLRAIDRTLPILVFSMHGEPSVVRKALAAGATGYVHKDAPPTEILTAVDRVRRGVRYLTGDLALQVALAPEPAARIELKDFTRREQEILTLLAEGRSYGEIAEELGISYKTVANVSSILKSKLDAETLPELVVKAIERTSQRSRRA